MGEIGEDVGTEGKRRINNYCNITCGVWGERCGLRDEGVDVTGNGDEDVR